MPGGNPIREILAVLAATMISVPGASAGAQVSEGAIKAAFIPKFARYIGMPPQSSPATGQPFYLCVIGRDPFGGLIDEAAGSETIDGHPVAVRRFATTDAPAIAGCHIAFVAGHDDAATLQMLAAMRRLPILTVTDSRRGRARGIIHFVIAGGRVRFHIDDAGAAERGITISSRLLALAVDVKARSQ